MQKYIHTWSGGKDSTASIILDHINNNPHMADIIVFAEVMFDLENEISGELPEHIDFINNIAIPKFESWGYTVIKVRSDKDYLSLFNQIITRSKVPDRNGKKNGFPIAGRCKINDRVKMKAVKNIDKIYKGYIHIVGIAIDEKERLDRLHNRSNDISLLEKYEYTEDMAYDLCKNYGLLSPIYENSSRGGVGSVQMQK